MGEIVKALASTLPDNDLLRFLIFVLALILIPVKPAVWIGQGLRYLVRWVRCQVFGAHSWIQISGMMNAYGQPAAGTVQCRVCLTTWHY